MNVFMHFALITMLVSLVAGSACFGGSYKREYKAIPLAVHSHQSVQVQPTNTVHYPKATYINVPTGVAPIYMNFQSRSSPLRVSNHHVSTPGVVSHSYSVDAPHKLYHHVTKPVYQEIHETVVPHRKIVQTVKPVSEMVQTLVHTKAHRHRYSSGGHGKY